jgi:anti-sigma B factor antagonist
MESKFHITSGAVDAHTHVIEPQGELDAATVPALEDAFDELIASGKRYVILDLEDVEFLDSKGVVAMIAARRRLADAGGELVTVSSDPHVRRVIEIVDDTSAPLRVVASRRDALRAASALTG